MYNRGVTDFALMTDIAKAQHPWLAERFAISRPAVSRHLRVLREVGLVRDRKAGKQRLYGLDARGLRLVHEWTGGFERFWNESLGRLDAYVQDLEQARQEE